MNTPMDSILPGNSSKPLAERVSLAAAYGCLTSIAEDQIQKHLDRMPLDQQEQELEKLKKQMDDLKEKGFKPKLPTLLKLDTFQDMTEQKKPELVRNVNSGSSMSAFCYPEWVRFKMNEFKDQVDFRILGGSKDNPPVKMKILSKEIVLAYNPAFQYF